MMNKLANALKTHIFIFQGPKQENKCEFTYGGTLLEDTPHVIPKPRGSARFVFKDFTEHPFLARNGITLYAFEFCQT
jgi:hypothetical protein